MRSFSHIRRRFFLTGTLAVPGVVLLPKPLAPTGGIEARFAALLTRLRLPLQGSEVTIVAFNETRQNDGTTTLTADLRLTWPPGIRHRRFRATQADPDMALAEVVEQAMAEFDATFPAGETI